MSNKLQASSISQGHTHAFPDVYQKNGNKLTLQIFKLKVSSGLLNNCDHWLYLVQFIIWVTSFLDETVDL